MTCDRKVIVDMVYGDLLPYLYIELELEDITGWTITLNVSRPDGTRIQRTAIVVAPNVGGLGNAEFYFDWAVGDLMQGENHAEVELFNTLGENQTFKGIIIRVSDEIS